MHVVNVVILLESLLQEFLSVVYNKNKNGLLLCHSHIELRLS